ncbi:glycine--tRNA ligase [Mollicutes bacterium LVI A0039]|nr:glycine--tRNA ligase [Mollicutes bacterium LVI A0039]
MENTYSMEELVAAAKSAGFVYQGSEIYGGLANSWDYGPLGAQLKANIKNLWWKEFVSKKHNNVGIDSSIIMNTNIWRASGHIGGFSDPLVDCKECKTRHRADKLIEDHANQEIVADGWTNSQMSQYLIDNNVVCPDCGKLNYTDIRQFDLMFSTNMGVVEDDTSKVYLRPETAQGIFVNFKNIQRTTRKKLPFGVGQIGKSFRNEITPGNFIFRTREFEQMEMEFFCKPGTELEWFNALEKDIVSFLNLCGIKPENMRIREHSTDELSHYSNKTSDIEFKYPFGWGELWGLASRTDFDLNAHQEASKQDLTYLDPETNERYLPYVIEPAVGVDRLFLAILANGYERETVGENDVREVLRLAPNLAPIKVAVLPLVKKLNADAEQVFANLCSEFEVEFDSSGKIGKRYRRYDAIGVPWCVTFDYDSLEDGCVTVRDRDTMEQTRVAISELNTYFRNLI